MPIRACPPLNPNRVILMLLPIRTDSWGRLERINMAHTPLIVEPGPASPYRPERSLTRTARRASTSPSLTYGFVSCPPLSCAVSRCVSSSSDNSVVPPNRSIMLVSNLSCPNSLLHTDRLSTFAISGIPSERAASAVTLISSWITLRWWNIPSSCLRILASRSSVSLTSGMVVACGTESSLTATCPSSNTHRCHKCTDWLRWRDSWARCNTTQPVTKTVQCFLSDP